MYTIFGRKKSDDELFSRKINKDDMVRIRDGWVEKCEAANITLSAKVHKELKKRLETSAQKDGGKPKLELSNCSIDDKQAKFLLINLAVSPVVAKLDLSGNSITDKVSTTCLSVYLSVFLCFFYLSIPRFLSPLAHALAG